MQEFVSDISGATTINYFNYGIITFFLIAIAGGLYYVYKYKKGCMDKNHPDYSESYFIEGECKNVESDPNKSNNNKSNNNNSSTQICDGSTNDNFKVSDITYITDDIHTNDPKYLIKIKDTDNDLIDFEVLDDTTLTNIEVDSDIDYEITGCTEKTCKTFLKNTDSIKIAMNYKDNNKNKTYTNYYNYNNNKWNLTGYNGKPPIPKECR